MCYGQKSFFPVQHRSSRPLPSKAHHVIHLVLYVFYNLIYMANLPQHLDMTVRRN